MPRLTYSPDESHQLLTAADTAAAAGADPVLADLYRELALAGVDLEACTPDEDLRAELGMPPLDAAAAGDGTGDAARGHGGGDRPHAA